MWAKVGNHAKTTPPSLSYPLCRCSIQPSVRNLIVYTTYNTSDMQGMLWGEPELSHVCVFDHMVFFHSHNVNEV